MNEEMLKDLGVFGPDRVLVDTEGTAVHMSRAVREYKTLPWIVFVRKDGWTLGAPRHLTETAYMLWADEWIAWTDRTCKELRPMSDEGWRDGG